MAIWKRGVIQPRLGFVNAEIFTKFWFCIHDFGYRYVRKPFKGPKDADFGLVSKNILSQNNGCLGWDSEPGKFGQKNAKTPPVVTLSPEMPKSKTKKVCLICSLRRAESAEGLNSSLA